METKEFNPTKEEFESMLNSTVTLMSLKNYYGITDKEINKYIWKHYRLPTKEFYEIFRNKHKIQFIGINKVEFEKLLSYGYGVNEVANYFMKKVEEVEAWCKLNYGKKVKEVACMCLMRTRLQLRIKQFDNVERGNAQVQMWMGKQIDEQKDTDKLILQKETKETDIEATPDVFDKIASALSKEE